MTIYGIKNCNTMKKAFDFLNAKGIAYEFHDYKKSGISSEKIQEWFKVRPWEDFINRKGLTWRKLSEDEKLALQGPVDAIKLMIEKTSLIKRPILETKEKIYLGFDDTWDNLKA
jgi:Spx/MgsR family transcriptional regulator